MTEEEKKEKIEILLRMYDKAELAERAFDNLVRAHEAEKKLEELQTKLCIEKLLLNELPVSTLEKIAKKIDSFLKEKQRQG